MTAKFKKTPDTKHIFCNRCRNETNHVMKAEHSKDFPNLNPDGSLGFIERLGYRLWICAGCDRGTLEEFYIFDITDEEYFQHVDEHYFPERAQFHVEDKNFRQLPDELNLIYRELLRAFNNDLRVLCALGIRALLEGICADKGITNGNLKRKINDMVSIPLPKNIVKNLHGIRFIGNEAAHKLAVPTKKDLKLAIQICEDLLNYIYELDYKAMQLTKSRQSQKSTKITTQRKIKKP